MKRLVVGCAYAVVLAYVAWQSYAAVLFRFHGSGRVLLLSFLGVALTLLWWRRAIPRRAWVLPAVLVAIALASFPDTSRDPLRYLFDGEMIRLLHASPYVRLPYDFPLDQYTRLFDHIWWTTIPSPYGPLWQALMVVINYVSGNTLTWGMLALKLVNLAGLVVGARYLYLLTRKPWVSFVFLINPVVLLNTVATPHTDIVIAVLVLAAFYHQRPAVQGGLVAAAALIKPHALLFAPFMATTWRQRLVIGGWTLALGGVMLLWLRPLVRFDLWPMLAAGQSGGLALKTSLLAALVLPGAAQDVVIMASYGLFVLVYGLIFAGYVRGRLALPSALALASMAVPLCLTSLLLPWHFLLPLALLLWVDRPWALAAVVFITALVLRSAVTVGELLALAALYGAAIGVTRWVLGRVSRRPAVIDRLIARFSA